MYFHPLILTEAQKQQRSAAYQDCADRRFDGIDRPHWLHTDAVSEFAIRREEKSRTLSGSIDTADFVVLCVARAASASPELLQGVGDKSASPRQKLRVQAVPLLIGLYDDTSLKPSSAIQRAKERGSTVRAGVA